ncbi:MAG TPA: DUF6069 family protein [Bacteroidia bacterium]|nr:DUF6069 family protein [Bacteroidia bacterium]
MKNKVNLSSALFAGVMAALCGSLINIVIFYLFHSLGILSDRIFIQPGQPLGLFQVIFASTVPLLIASLVFFLFEKYTANGYRIFSIVAVILLLLSFLNPFMTIPGVTILYGIVLNLMHVVVVFFLLYFLKRANDKANNKTA